VTNAKQPGSSTPIRLVGTFDDKGTLLFSRGYKNFQDKNSCDWCHVKRPWMHHYALAKKGEKPNFSDASFCSVECYRKRDKSPFQQTPGGLQVEPPTC
jgi:hypothetical protein